MKKYSFCYFVIVFVFLFYPIVDLKGQTIDDFSKNKVESSMPKPGMAFLKSLVVPGWGQYYNDPHNWNQGKVHIILESVLWMGVAGLTIYSNSMDKSIIGYVKTHANTDLTKRDRRYRLAVSNYNSTQDYNAYLLRSRQRDSIYPEDDPSFQWQWENSDARQVYLDKRHSIENLRNQIPIIIALASANHLISAISAYVQARKNRKIQSNLMMMEQKGTIHGLAVAVKINW